MDDLPTLEDVARSLIDSANAIRVLALNIAAVIGLWLVISGLQYGANWYRDQRRSVVPMFLRPSIGVLLIASGLTWSSTRYQIFGVDVTYTYSAAVGLHSWELAMLSAVSEIARVAGIVGWIVGLALISGARLGPPGESRVVAGAVTMLGGFFLAEHALFITLVTNELLIPSPFVPSS